LTLPDFLQRIETHKLLLKQALLKHGALLFKATPLTQAGHFSQFIETLGLGQFVNYIGGDSPRDKVAEGVYTSTEAPPNFHIPLHQELSFIRDFPRHIYFFCEIPPVAGGETIIADARLIHHAFSAEFKKPFQEKGITYISRYYYRSKIMEWLNQFKRSHKSWIEVFETTQKEDVERKCIENDFEFRWLQRDWLEIRQTRPAFCEHPLTKEIVWFNQVHLYDFNPRLLGLNKYLGEKLFYRKNTRLHEVQFANGEKILRKDLYHILDQLNDHTVYFSWKKGDILVLDNILAMHGRAPFTGRRRILAAMTS
jgi:alpha-ketoglutarate-dependent taurine dioxygenase